MNILIVLINKIKVIWEKVRNWGIKNSKWLIYILIVLVSTTVAHTLFKKDNNLPLPQTIIDYKEVKKWKDAYNQEHNTLKATQLSAESFKLLMADSIAKILKVKSKDIVSVTSVTSKGDIESEPKTVYIDTSKTYSFSDSNNYYTVDGTLDTRVSQTRLRLSTVDTFNIVPYKKRTFFKETQYIDVTNKNPYNHIMSGYSYTQTENIKRFGIGPNVSYDPINNKISVGIGLQYNIIRF